MYRMRSDETPKPPEREEAMTNIDVTATAQLYALTLMNAAKRNFNSAKEEK